MLQETIANHKPMVTGIGSLPLKNPETAINFIAETCPIFPYWPQLPRRSRQELMIAQVLGPLDRTFKKGRRTYGYTIEEEHLNMLTAYFSQQTPHLNISNAAGFFAFEKALEADHFPQALALKGQLVGPITLAGQLFFKDSPLLYNFDLMELIVNYIGRLALWQLKRLQKWDLPVLILIDEPGLIMTLPDKTSKVATHKLIQFLNKILKDIRAEGGIAGIHCCGAFPASVIPQLMVDVISFDAHQELEILLCTVEMQRFIQRGGMVGFGMIPTWPGLDTLDPEMMFSRWLAAAEEGQVANQLPQQTIITPVCGLGLQNNTIAHQAFDMAQQLTTLIGSHFGVGNTNLLERSNT